ncbi:MAG: hypothetical protein C5B54_04245 [Acidobacteria bacterium]|nr:MAG: hypothetical protein C5B54_04245 [Acidobacteriota bacterium]
MTIKLDRAWVIHLETRLEMAEAALARVRAVIQRWRELAHLTDDLGNCADEVEQAMMESSVQPVVHWLVAGRAACGAGDPTHWASGDRWVATGHGEPSEVTCAACRQAIGA